MTTVAEEQLFFWTSPLLKYKYLTLKHHLFPEINFFVSFLIDGAELLLDLGCSPSLIGKWKDVHIEILHFQ